MINNFNKDFFNKNNRLKLCSIALTGLMVVSPFIVRGMVDTAIDNLDHHNEPIVVQEDNAIEEDTSRITIEYEGEYNKENGVIVIIENKERGPDDEIEVIAIITPNADDPHCELPAGNYIIENYTNACEIELDGQTDYTFKVNYQDGTIKSTDEQTNIHSHTRQKR